jgi:hypothetical protein
VSLLLDAIVTSFVLVIVNCLFAHLKNLRNNKNYSNTIKMSAWIFYFSIFASLLFAVAIYNNKSMLPDLVMFSIAELLSLYVLIYQVNFRIFYDENIFVYQNFFRRSRTFSYDNIRNIRFRDNFIILKIQNKSFYINILFFVGYENFLKNSKKNNSLLF